MAETSFTSCLASAWFQARSSCLIWISSAVADLSWEIEALDSARLNSKKRVIAANGKRFIEYAFLATELIEMLARMVWLSFGEMCAWCVRRKALCLASQQRST